jgi:transcription termination factor Rho
MNYSEIIDELNKASLFDLFRLNVAIDKQLDNPEKLNRIKNQLKIDQNISYFDIGENRLIEAKVIKIKRTQVLVRNHHDGQRWNISFYMLNLDHVDTDIHASPSQELDKNNLRVGDKVYFKDRDGKEQYGAVYKLNPKTAGVLVGNAKWRVYYQSLSLIIEGELADKQQLLR